MLAGSRVFSDMFSPRGAAQARDSCRDSQGGVVYTRYMYIHSHLTGAWVANVEVNKQCNEGVCGLRCRIDEWKNH